MPLAEEPHPLFKQGQYWFTVIGMWSAEKVKPLLEVYDHVLRDHALRLENLGEI